MNQFDDRWIKKFQKEENKEMSTFELQPATPSVKEIFDIFEEEFFDVIKDADMREFAEMRDLFIAAKINTVQRLLDQKGGDADGINPL